ncbi:Dyp-type peroxidase [Acinetobacter halotolerans]|uniref:Dyp-type peroxidase n=1 Tax=Acinetobacter halotolerans TaxID=1752076 RepID=A0A4Q6XGH3_9GAMM|nr:Dyp-type peroxidase [Acinetobacter halotolerans]RZF49882.1 Dyp-type peroxidase [Acinetobacter halotolerans]
MNIPLRPQPVINNLAGENALFIVLGINSNPDHSGIIDFLANFSALVRSMANRFPNSQFTASLGIGSHAWDLLFPDLNKPKELQPFQEIKGSKYTAVATSGDLFFHIRANQMAICYELASIIHDQLKESSYPISETKGFRYFDGRAILGFVDGTENPEHEIAKEIAYVGEEDIEFLGGSYVFIQKYLHNMEMWKALSTEEQEKVIGRKKYDDVELSDDVKPQNAHNVVSKAHDADGNELKILRANMPFSNPSEGESGTFFIGYSRSFNITKTMLENMFLGKENGHVDRLLDFSTPVSGSLFFVPTFDFLEDLAE